MRPRGGGRPAPAIDRDWWAGDHPTIDHLCRNKRCVNPAHLEVVSLAENNYRAAGTVRVAWTWPESPGGRAGAVPTGISAEPRSPTTSGRGEP